MLEGHLPQVEAEAIEEAIQHQEHEQQDEHALDSPRGPRARLVMSCTRPCRRHHRLHIQAVSGRFVTTFQEASVTSCSMSPRRPHCMHK